MQNNLYRIETTGAVEHPKFNGYAMLYCDGGIAFVNLHPVKLTAHPKCEVQHGCWVWKQLHGDDYETLVCSNCLSPDGAREIYNYCPNCGAKMINGVHQYEK
jgi:hypothetical protein